MSQKLVKKALLEIKKNSKNVSDRLVSMSSIAHNIQYNVGILTNETAKKKINDLKNKIELDLKKLMITSNFGENPHAYIACNASGEVEKWADAILEDLEAENIIKG